MQTVDWYFDFISPFAYLQHELLLRDHPELPRTYRPVLLGALLGHWGIKGPAEVTHKRQLTYHHCQWLAEQHDIPMRFPPAHPFNPLPPLRLVLAAGVTEANVSEIFRAVFATGDDLSNPTVWQQLAQRCGVADPDTSTNSAEVKAQLRHNTEQAIQRGVFGVPTLYVGARQFWGLDTTEMALTQLADPQRFNGGEYQRLAQLPVGIARKN